MAKQSMTAAKKASKRTGKPKVQAKTKRKSGSGLGREIRALTREMKIMNALVKDLSVVSYELDQIHRAYRLRAVRTREDVLREANAKEIELKFKKKSGPDFVRITLRDREEEVLAPGTGEGISKSRPVGIDIDAFIEVKGNPGQIAVVEVENAIPSVIQMSALPGETGNRGTKPLLVVG